MNQIPEQYQPRKYQSVYDLINDKEIDEISIYLPQSVDDIIANLLQRSGKAPMLITKDVADPRRRARY